MLRTKRINTKFVLSHGAILLFLFIVSLLVFLVSNSQKFDGLRINLAGRQRMLSQRMTKEILLYSKRETDPDKIQLTMTIFEETLNALKDGGKAPLDTALKDYVYLPQMETKTTFDQLKIVQDHWFIFKDMCNSYITNKNETAYNYIIANNIPLLSEMNTAVVMMQATSEGKTQRLLFIIIIGVSLSVVTFIISLFMTRSITRPLIHLVGILKAYENGQLNKELPSSILNRSDEVGQLAQSLNNMNKKIGEIIKIVHSGSNEMTTASMELASGNQDLADRSEEQTDLLEKTTIEIGELNQSIKNNAEHTDAAKALAQEALDKSVKGSAAVHDIDSSMQSISQTSNQITSIIEVINNIAFQTNLLALNASIEAARAGEQGKGFAVVAVEVRKLAKRSNKAADEISDIIKNSSNRVNEGVKITQTARKVLDDINRSVSKVTSLVSDITITSQKQINSVIKIEKTVENLNDHTQRNAAMVEETAAATEELSSQSQELRNTISYFKID